MVQRWLSLMRGQVQIVVTGAHLTRFLNACAAGGVWLHRIRRTDWNTLQASVSLSDFRALRRQMGRTGCRVHIVRRRGAPFLLHRLRGRTMLWGGLLAALALFYLLSTRIWALDIHIDPMLPRGAILSELAARGVCVGARRDAIDVKKIRFQMLRAQPDLSYLMLNVHGNELSIYARGSIPAPELIDESEPAKIVAARDGVIAALRVQEGETLVRVGDAVRAGETLVSGLVPPRTETGQYRLAHARASVMAYTACQSTIKRPLTVRQKGATRRTKVQYAILFGKRRLNLYFGSGISGATCDKIVETKTLHLSQSVALPITLVRQTYRYYETEEQTILAESLRQELLRRALAKLTDGMEGQVTALHSTLTTENGAAVMRLEMDACEEIGRTEPDASELPPPKTATPQE